MEHSYIMVYTNAFCPVCNMVKDFFDAMDTPYEEVNINIRPLTRIKLIGKTGKLTVPQTNIDGKWISGFDPMKIMQALENHETKEEDGI